MADLTSLGSGMVVFEFTGINADAKTLLIGGVIIKMQKMIIQIFFLAL